VGLDERVVVDVWTEATVAGAASDRRSDGVERHAAQLRHRERGGAKVLDDGGARMSGEVARRRQHNHLRIVERPDRVVLQDGLVPPAAGRAGAPPSARPSVLTSIRITARGVASLAQERALADLDAASKRSLITASHRCVASSVAESGDTTRFGTVIIYDIYNIYFIRIDI